MALAQSSIVTVNHFDADGAVKFQQQTQAASIIMPAGATHSSSSVTLNSAGQAVMTQTSLVTTTQPSPAVNRSESTTQAYDKNGNVRRQTKATMTETRVNSDTTQTETTFQESGPNPGQLITSARMKETRKETSSGTEYQRVIEVKTVEGEFRPKQKVQAVTEKFTDGSSKTRSVESSIDLNGNARVTQETIEKQSTDSRGRETIERVIKKPSVNGELRLDRVEIEENHTKATSGVVNEKLVKRADSSYGLREVQRITTTVETPSGSAPYRLVVTKGYPRNDRTAAIITQVEIERSRTRGDGSTFTERELKVRDVNGELTTVSVTQIENSNHSSRPPEVVGVSNPNPSLLASLEEEQHPFQERGYGTTAFDVELTENKRLNETQGLCAQSMHSEQRGRP
jgi:hypothetical protein